MSSAPPPGSASDPATIRTPRADAERLEAALAWAAWLVAVAGGVIGSVYVGLDQSTGHPVLQQTPLSGLAGAAIAATYGSVGLLLVLRRPGLVIGWLFVGIGVVAGLSNLAWGYVWYGATLGSAPGPVAVIDVAWLNNALTYSAWTASAMLLVLLFPDGRPLTPPWRKVALAIVGAAVVLALGLAVEPGPMRLFTLLDNPLPAPEPLGQPVEIVISAALLALLVAGALSLRGLVLRYRRGSVTERRQLRWFAWGSGLTVAGGGVLIVVALVAVADSRTVDLGWLVFAVASMTLPVAALIAILRERLYDIDRLISRTFVYGLLTATLAGLYAALIRLFNAIFVDVTGQSSETSLVLTTLILATTFTPIKQALEKVVARRLVPAPLPADADAGPLAAIVDVDELDRRIEAIARRVSLEVAADLARPSRPARQVDKAP
jgi:two-component system, NarL family, sensor kinase